MKWRIKRKKIKKHHICDMWLKCSDDWHTALCNIEAKYPEGTDPNDYEKTDGEVYITGCEMLRFDWCEYLKCGEQIGFGYKDMNHYANEWDFK